MSKNLKFFIIIGAILLIIFVILLFTGIIPGVKQSKKDIKILEMWGVDEAGPYLSIIQSFQKDFPNFRVNYIQKDKKNYEKDLINAFLSQKGPDIFMIENTWLPRYIDQVYPAPSSVISLKEFQSKIIEGVANEFLGGNKILGMPIYVDTLGLIYNDNLLKSAGFVKPPEDWEEFVKISKAITRRDKALNIEISGAALGLSENIETAPDILELLIMQTGLDIIDIDGEVAFNRGLVLNGKEFRAGENALSFYSNFANSSKDVYSWNGSFASAFESFARGQVGMIFAYSSDIGELKKKAPKLNFKTSIFPEPKGTVFKINLARFFAPVVFANSLNRDEAWRFLKYLTEETINEYYTEEFNRPTSLVNLIEKQLKTAPVELEPFIKQSLTAKNFYQFDNYEIERLFRKMINKANKGETNHNDIIAEVAEELKNLMK